MRTKPATKAAKTASKAAPGQRAAAPRSRARSVPRETSKSNRAHAPIDSRRAASDLDSIEDAIAAIRRGEIVIVVDDAERENEGDLVMAAEKVTPDAINFIAQACARAHLRSRCRRSGSTRSSSARWSPRNTALHRHAVHGFGRRACAARRPASRRTTARATIRAADRSADPARGPRAPRARLPAARGPRRRAAPRRAHRGGPRPRAARGSPPAGVLCEIMDDDGHMARVAASSARFAKRYRLRHPHDPATSSRTAAAREMLVKRLVQTALPDARTASSRSRSTRARSKATTTSR